MRTLRMILGLVLLFGGLSACDRAPSETQTNPKADSPQHQREQTRTGPQAADEDEDEACGCEKLDCQCSKNGHRYSAFGVELTGGKKFDLVSFKDVGLESSPYQSTAMLEILAQSLAYQLQRHKKLDLSARLLHDERLANPSKHTYCEARRLYVDVWHSPSPSRWGYSLWSGCSEAMQFARREIDIEGETDDLKSAIRPLTKSIAQSLGQANRQGCYRRRC